MLAVRVEGLTKDFSGLRAVNEVSFQIESGRVFGLLGPNGAGKSTTLAMLSTVLRPTAGAAWVNDYDIRTRPDDVRRSIGIVFQDQSLDEELTARENMDMHGRLYHVPRPLRQRRIGELMELVGLSDRASDFVKTFSGGMRRRLEIARGLLHEPKVLFLDEPTLGLDPQTRNHLWTYIAALNRDKQVTIIRAMAAVKDAEIRGGSISVKLDHPERHIAEMVTRCAADAVSVTSLSVHQPTLEDVFLHFTGRTIREEDASGKDRMRMARRLWRR